MNLAVWKYRYVIVFGFFLLWMTFFDRNSFIYRISLAGDINDLEESIEEHETRIRDLRIQKKDLFGNAQNLEKFAREKYLMKKDGEDIFVIVDP